VAGLKFSKDCNKVLKHSQTNVTKFSKDSVLEYWLYKATVPITFVNFVTFFGCRLFCAKELVHNNNYIFHTSTTYNNNNMIHESYCSSHYRFPHYYYRYKILIIKPSSL
jgi:hypothetical protein